jgi:hypothetical protein
LKGQTHAHTAGSGDSDTAPVDAMRWYARRGFDFVVITDHNSVTSVPGGVVDDMLVLPGAELTQNLRSCTPPPAQSESCLLHLNALFVDEAGAGAVAIAGREGEPRVDTYRRALAETSARGGLAQLNHPNFHHAADAALLTTLAGDGVTLVEIAFVPEPARRRPALGSSDLLPRRRTLRFPEAAAPESRGDAIFRHAPTHTWPLARLLLNVHTCRTSRRSSPPRTAWRGRSPKPPSARSSNRAGATW